MQINQLSQSQSIALGDLFPVYLQNNGGVYSVSFSVLVAAMQPQLTGTDNKITQYFQPASTGWSVIVNGLNIISNSLNTWLVLTPVSIYASGTITLPPVLYCIDKQELLVNCTNGVTALTVAGNGANVIGAPTNLASQSFFRLRFDGVTQTWYRVG